MKTAHNLLDDPLLTWRGVDRRRQKTTLPGAIARIANGELQEFPRARAHQFHPWCMFLTQLASIALHRAVRTDAQLHEDDWRALLVSLTDGQSEPWCLVVDNLSQPAFLQPPVPEETLDGWTEAAHPDDIDVLVTSKAHDVKASLISSGDIEAWIFALVTLQTTQGYPGRGYTRISRMKRGYGSRPRVGVAPDQGLSGRFVRDVGVLLNSWRGLVQRGFADDGLALVWTVPWDGTTGLAMPELSPHFIEICRRIRCTASHDTVSCRYTTTTARRCLPEIDNGDVGDAWIPVEREGGALTVGSSGFHYELLSKLLFEGDFEPAAAQRLRPDDPDPTLFLASVTARGQGKTEGIHDRTLLLTPEARRRLGKPDMRAALGRVASNNVQQARKMRSKILYPALRQLALGETVPDDFFNARVDEMFFDHLFGSLDLAEDDAAAAWMVRLHQIAWDELQGAIQRCCVPSARWYQAVSDAEGMFRGCLRKQFPTMTVSTKRGDPDERD